MRRNTKPPSSLAGSQLGTLLETCSALPPFLCAPPSRREQQRGAGSSFRAAGRRCRGPGSCAESPGCGSAPAFRHPLRHKNPLPTAGAEPGTARGRRAPRGPRAIVRQGRGVYERSVQTLCPCGGERAGLAAALAAGCREVPGKQRERGALLQAGERCGVALPCQERAWKPPRSPWQCRREHRLAGDRGGSSPESPGRAAAGEEPAGAGPQAAPRCPVPGQGSGRRGRGGAGARRWLRGEAQRGPEQPADEQSWGCAVPAGPPLPRSCSCPGVRPGHGPGMGLGSPRAPSPSGSSGLTVLSPRPTLRRPAPSATPSW